MSQGVGYPNHYFFNLAIDQFFPRTISRQFIVMVRTGCMPVYNKTEYYNKLQMFFFVQSIFRKKCLTLYKQIINSHCNLGNCFCRFLCDVCEGWQKTA